MASKSSKEGGSRAPVAVTDYVLPCAAVAAHVYYLWHEWETTFKGVKPSAAVAGLSINTPIALTAAYLVMVFAGKKLMQSMKNKDGTPFAFEVRAAIRVYNIYLIALSAFMCGLLALDTLVPALTSGAPFWDIALDDTPRGARLAFALWVNYNSKYIEFLDTVWMLARNRPEQLSFLHWQHHAVMGPIMWFVTTGCPGGTSYFAPMLNAFVHTVMYTWYALASFGIRASAFKMPVTALQMAQFVVISCHAGWHLAGPSAGAFWTRSLGITEALLMVDMLVLFGDFFVGAYLKKASSKGAKAA